MRKNTTRLKQFSCSRSSANFPKALINVTYESLKKKLPKQWKILAETYLTYAHLASFVTPSTKDHEVRNRLAHTTDDVSKKRDAHVQLYT